MWAKLPLCNFVRSFGWLNMPTTCHLHLGVRYGEKRGMLQQDNLERETQTSHPGPGFSTTTHSRHSCTALPLSAASDAFMSTFRCGQRLVSAYRISSRSPEVVTGIGPEPARELHHSRGRHRRQRPWLPACVATWNASQILHRMLE